MANTKNKNSLPTVKTSKEEPRDFIERIQNDLESRQTLISLILGALIVIVLGILLFNFFNKPNGEVGTSSNTETAQTEDVSKDNLPGKYTVKEGDTLFLIAQKYYDDGYKFDKIASENKISDPNNIEIGQVLDIPKLEDNSLAEASESPSTIPETTPQTSSEEAAVDNSSPETSPSTNSEMKATTQENEQAVGGAENETVWGEKITEDSYTVKEGDWLSKIAGRAYGDIYVYNKIAEANNISNPDLIEPGTILKIPR